MDLPPVAGSLDDRALLEREESLTETLIVDSQGGAQSRSRHRLPGLRKYCENGFGERCVRVMVLMLDDFEMCADPVLSRDELEGNRFRRGCGSVLESEL